MRNCECVSVAEALPVYAVCITNDGHHVLVGAGGDVIMYNLDNGSLMARGQVLPNGINIHGIVLPAIDRTANQASTLPLPLFGISYGGKHVHKFTLDLPQVKFSRKRVFHKKKNGDELNHRILFIFFVSISLFRPLLSSPLSLSLSLSPLSLFLEQRQVISTGSVRCTDWVLDARLLDSNVLCIGCANNYIELWELSGFSKISRINSPLSPFLSSMSITFQQPTPAQPQAGGELWVACGTMFGHVVVFDATLGIQAENNVVTTNCTSEAKTLTSTSSVALPTQKGVIHTIKWTHDGCYVVCGSEDRTIAVLKWHGFFQTTRGEHFDSLETSSTRGLEKHAQWFAHHGIVWNVALSNSGLIVSTSQDASCRVWDFNGRKVVNQTCHAGKHVRAIDISDSSGMFVSGGDDSSVNVWSLPSAASTLSASHNVHIIPLPPHGVGAGQRAKIVSLMWLDSRTIVAGIDDGRLLAFSIPTLKFSEIADFGNSARVSWLATTASCETTIAMPQPGMLGPLCLVILSNGTLHIYSNRSTPITIAHENGQVSQLERVLTFQAYSQRALRVWNVQNSDSSHKAQMLFATVGVDDDKVLAFKLLRFDPSSGTISIEHRLALPENAGTPTAVSRFGSIVLAGTSRGNLYIYDISKPSSSGTVVLLNPVVIGSRIHRSEPLTAIQILSRNEVNGSNNDELQNESDQDKESDDDLTNNGSGEQQDSDDVDTQALALTNQSGEVLNLTFETLGGDSYRITHELKIYLHHDVCQYLLKQTLQTKTRLGVPEAFAIDSTGQRLVHGFTEKRFLLCGNDGSSVFLEFVCGGVQRPHHFLLHPDIPMLSQVAYSDRDKGICVLLPSESASQGQEILRRSMHARGHGRNIDCVLMIDGTDLILSGGEDTLMKIHRCASLFMARSTPLSHNNPSETSLVTCIPMDTTFDGKDQSQQPSDEDEHGVIRCVGSYHGHRASVRAMVARQLANGDHVVWSCGSQETLICWIIQSGARSSHNCNSSQLQPVSSSAAVNVLAAGTHHGTIMELARAGKISYKKPMTNIEVQAKELDFRYMAVCVEAIIPAKDGAQNFLVFCGTSEGKIEVFFSCPQQRLLKKLSITFDVGRGPILSMASISIASSQNSFLIVGTKQGALLVFSIGDLVRDCGNLGFHNSSHGFGESTARMLLEVASAHPSGVNALSVSLQASNNTFIVGTGGDDASVGVLCVQLDANCEQVLHHQWTTALGAHCAAVRGVSVVAVDCTAAVTQLSVNASDSGGQGETRKVFLLSAGMDNRMNLFRYCQKALPCDTTEPRYEMELQHVGVFICDVSHITAMSVTFDLLHRELTAVVSGCGMQIIRWTLKIENIIDAGHRDCKH
jgi:WD40 repeat protein